jgi:hypothetical protein
MHIIRAPKERKSEAPKPESHAVKEAERKVKSGSGARHRPSGPPHNVPHLPRKFSQHALHCRRRRLQGIQYLVAGGRTRVDSQFDLSHVQ